MCREAESQDAVFEFRLHVVLVKAFSYIEASLHGARITLLTDQFALVGLVLIKPLGGADNKIAIVQLDRDLIFRETRQIDIKFIMVFVLMHVCLHQPVGVPAVKLSFGLVHVSDLREIKPVIKQILSKNTRY